MKRAITLDDSQRRVLNRWVRSRTVSVRWRARAQIILAATKGRTDQDIAAELGTTRHRVARWRSRFVEGGVEALKKDLPRGGRPLRIDAGKAQEIVRLTTQTTPANATHWSTRSMAAHAGVSDSTVLRIWRAHGLKPHRVESFKLSNDPQFAEKLEAIVGLYLSPPEHALVLCCDEKSQIQALDRTQPGLDAYFYSETGVYKQPLILFQLVVLILFATYASWVKHQAPTKMVRIASLFSKFLVVFFMFLGFLSLIVISGFGGMVG